MSSTAFLSQKEQKIRHLISGGKLKMAYAECIEIIKQHPGENSFQKMKKEIEEIVASKNQQLIEAKLQEIDTLWKQAKYGEMIRQLEELLKLDPQNRKITQYLQKARTAYRQSVKEMQQQFEQQQKNRLDKLLKTDPDNLVDELFKLEQDNPGNVEIQTLAMDYRNRIIEQKISSKRELIHSDKFDIIDNFIEELRQIDKTNQHIDTLARQTMQRRRDSQLENRSTYVYEGEKHLETLMKLKKYDKALQVANEILQTDPSNTGVRKLLPAIERKLFAQNRELTIASIEKSQNALQTSYKQHPDQYIRL